MTTPDNDEKMLDLASYYATWEQMEKNEARCGKPGADRCYLCHRPVSPTDKTVWIEVVEGGGWAADQTQGSWVDENGPGYCGMYPIGSTCAGRIPKRFHGKSWVPGMQTQERRTT